jgi:DNA-binding MarR family transcriptional regulator
MGHDHVDRVLAQWAVERPDIDASPMSVVSRISRLEKFARKSMETVFAQHGLTPEGFDVLATLRRSGPPYQLTPTQLFQMLMVSSGTMTNRLDRLEQVGYIARLPDPADRRGTLIHLTPEGREVQEKALTDHLANERRLLGGLVPEEQAALASLLRKLLLPLEIEAKD